MNQLTGDGIRAPFGAPVAHVDHAVRAGYAAIDMQAAIRPYVALVWRDYGIKAQIRVGLNSGEVVVRAIGSDLRVDYSAVNHRQSLTRQFATRAAAASSSASIRPERERTLAESEIESTASTAEKWGFHSGDRRAETALKMATVLTASAIIDF